VFVFALVSCSSDVDGIDVDGGVLVDGIDVDALVVYGGFFIIIGMLYHGNLEYTRRLLVFFPKIIC
jgi:hypothetical protein